MEIRSFNREVKIDVLRVTHSATQNWLGQSITAIIQVAPEVLEKIPDRVVMGEHMILNVQMEGEKLRCVKCGREGRIRVECNEKKKGEEPF